MNKAELKSQIRKKARILGKYRLGRHGLTQRVKKEVLKTATKSQLQSTEILVDLAWKSNNLD